MAQDEVVVVYKAVPEGFDKVNASVNSVTAETKELQQQIKATFADKSIEEATRKLYEQGDVMGALVNKYGSATTALKAMEKELATMAALGQRGTAQFKELANATAELKDTIGDTRGEIKKMASDTRVFDTMVQGARGIAAAFSVATGLAASFGSENKQLQQTLLKVQGAMAALQGVQELANIATEKGGIATKAYGVALTVVDKISKVTGLSMAASWALATGGITLVIGALTTLYFWFQKNQDASEELALQEKARKEKQEEIDVIIRANTTKANQLEYEQEKLLAKTKQETADAEIRYNQEIAASLEAKIRGLKGMIGAFNESEKGTKEYNDANGLLLDTQLAYTATLQKIKEAENGLATDRKKEAARIKATPIENVTAYSLPDAPPKDFTKNFLEGVQEDVNMQKAVEIPFKPVMLKKDLEHVITEFKEFMHSDYIKAVENSLSSISKLTSSIAESRTQQLRAEAEEQSNILASQRDKELFSVGENAERRRAIEERYAKKKMDLERKMAIEKAKIDRQQAITNKAIAIFTIAINTARAVSEYIGGLPGTAALMAIAIATGAIEAAAVAAQPLPEIPKFEKGGKVLAGGRNADGHLIGRSHREGGILIEAQGGEYIWDRDTTAKHSDMIQAAHENRIEDLMMHKYVVPMMKNKMQTESDSYDDWLLRATIKNGQKADKKNAEYIADKVSQSVNSAIYNQNRYR